MPREFRKINWEYEPRAPARPSNNSLLNYFRKLTIISYRIYLFAPECTFCADFLQRHIIQSIRNIFLAMFIIILHFSILHFINVKRFDFREDPIRANGLTEFSLFFF